MLLCGKKPRTEQEKAPQEDGSAVLPSQKELLREVKAKPNSRKKPSGIFVRSSYGIQSKGSGSNSVSMQYAVAGRRGIGMWCAGSVFRE